MIFLVVEFKIFGTNLTYRKALEKLSNIPDGWSIADYQDAVLVLNSPEVFNVERQNLYFIKPFINETNLKLSIVWVGVQNKNSKLVGDLNCLTRRTPRGILIKR